jgi:hypothetical protein
VDLILYFAGQNTPQKASEIPAFILIRFSDFAGQNTPQKAIEIPAIWWI